MSALISTTDVANHFNCSRADVSYWCSSGLVKALPKTGQSKPWRIFRSEIARLEKEGLPPSRRTLERR